jgi:acyl-CoA synthetase (NDP forming)
MPIQTNELHALFDPESIAIIGASADAKRIGGRPLKYLQQNRFKGRIYPVNPKYGEINGLKCYADITQIPDEIDLAIISLPGQAVLESVKQCAQKGVRSIIVFSSGFGEVDDEGKRQQEEIAGIARAHGIRLLGPNCLGLFNTNNGVFATFSTILESQTPYRSKISFVSQSGAFGSYVYTLARQHQIGFSHFVATGNESDIDAADCIAYFAQDENTDVIACYVEGVKNGEKFLQALRMAAENRKPVVVLKVGRTDEGRQAAMSHTGSLAGADEVYDEVFRQYGAYRANTVEEFIDVVYGCSKLPLPKGERVAVFTVSGGIGIMLADALTENGLRLPQPPEDVQQRLKDLLPYAGVNNPIDTTAQLNVQPELLGQFMEAVLDGGIYDAAIAFLGFTGLYSHTLQARLPSLEQIARRYGNIPLITITLHDENSKKQFEDRGLFLVENPTQAVRILKALHFFNRFYADMPDHRAMAQPKIVAVPSGASVLTEFESKKWLAQYGIPVTREKLATTAEEAVAHAREIGFPVVLKGMSPQILHKSDLGLVQLRIQNELETVAKFEEIRRRIEQTEGAQFDGVLVQEMLAGDAVEMFIGAKRDPVFGQMVVTGIGGIFIEVFNDAVMRKAPITVEEAVKMLRELRGFKILQGARGKPPCDIEALGTVIARFSEMLAGAGSAVREIDMNPIMVFANGQGVKVADALITLNN